MQTETVQKKDLKSDVLPDLIPAGAFEISYQQAIEITLARWAARDFNNLLITKNCLIFLINSLNSYS